MMLFFTNAGEKPEAVRTHLRDALIVPEMIGSVIGVYNGKTFNQARLPRSCAWSEIPSCRSGKPRAPMYPDAVPMSRGLYCFVKLKASQRVKAQRRHRQQLDMFACCHAFALMEDGHRHFAAPLSAVPCCQC